MDEKGKLQISSKHITFVIVCYDAELSYQIESYIINNRIHAH